MSSVPVTYFYHFLVRVAIVRLIAIKNFLIDLQPYFECVCGFVIFNNAVDSTFLLVHVNIECNAAWKFQGFVLRNSRNLK